MLVLLDHTDLLTLCARVDDWTLRWDFFHSVVNNDHLHVDIGTDIWVKLPANHPDYYLVLELEVASAFTCRRYAVSDEGSRLVGSEDDGAARTADEGTEGAKLHAAPLGPERSQIDLRSLRISNESSEERERRLAALSKVGSKHRAAQMLEERARSNPVAPRK